MGEMRLRLAVGMYRMLKGLFSATSDGSVAGYWWAKCRMISCHEAAEAAARKREQGE